MAEYVDQNAGQPVQNASKGAAQPQSGIAPPNAGTLRRKWLSRIRREADAHASFRREGQAAAHQFRAEADKTFGKPEAPFPVFWANCKITHAAIFNRQPKPDVRRRVQDSAGDKTLALCIERAIAYQQDTTPFDEHSTAAVMDFVSCGLGQTRVYMETETAQEPVVAAGEAVMGGDGKPEMAQVITAQKVCIEYIPWSRFRWEPAKSWNDVGWVGYDHYWSREEIREHLGIEIAGSDTSADDAGADDGSNGVNTGLQGKGLSGPPSSRKYAAQYLVHEIHDKKTRRVMFMCEGEESIWVDRAPKLNLQGFFDCPRPMVMNLKTGEFLPKPEYSYIRKLCEQINKLTDRLMKLTDQVRDISIYDASLTNEFTQIIKSQEDGTMIPVAAMIERLKGAGTWDNVVLTKDNRARIVVIQALAEELAKSKAELYELTGISDIVRGSTVASETASAQQLKGQWANVRLSEKMREVAMHFRSVFRLIAEVIGEQFAPEQIAQQTGITLTPEQQQILKSDFGRTYAIDIETDSTIAQDESQEKSDRIEFFDKVTGAIGTLVPAQAAGQLPADLVNALLMFVTRSFRHGRMLEEVIEQMPTSVQQLQTMQQQVQEAQQQIADLTAQLEDAQKQLAGVDQAKMAKDQQEAAADGIRAQNDVVVGESTARLNEARTAQIVDGILNPKPVIVRPPAGSKPRPV